MKGVRRFDRVQAVCSNGVAGRFRNDDQMTTLGVVGIKFELLILGDRGLIPKFQIKDTETKLESGLDFIRICGDSHQVTIV